MVKKVVASNVAAIVTTKSAFDIYLDDVINGLVTLYYLRRIRSLL
jgi:hypothetical protein